MARAAEAFRNRGYRDLPRRRRIAQTPQPGVFSYRVEASGAPPRNSTALVLDSLNTPVRDSTVTRAQMRRYLNAPYRARWKPAPEATIIRAVVRDMRTGQYRSLDTPLTGPRSNRPSRSPRP